MIRSLIKIAGIRIKEHINGFARDDKGIGVVELILILVEKPNAKHRYVLCGK